MISDHRPMAFLKVIGNVIHYKGQKQLNIIHMVDVEKVSHFYRHLLEAMYMEMLFEKALVSDLQDMFHIRLILVEASVEKCRMETQHT
jgi:hypothetical protein